MCYRLWDEPQTASLAAFTQPEILSADLSPLVLDLAQWGSVTPPRWRFWIRRPAPALKEARSLLTELGALDGDGRITAEGKNLRALALPPRLARMIVICIASARAKRLRKLRLCSTERGLGGDSVDLDARSHQFRRDRSQRASRRALSGAAMGLAGGGDGGAIEAATLCPPPASCSLWHFPTASRAIAAMAVLSLPTDAAPQSTRLPHWRARPISRLPN